MAIVKTQAAGKIGENYVFSELLKRDAIPYVPLVDIGVDALVRTSSGRFVEVQIKTAGGAGGQSLWFQLRIVAQLAKFVTTRFIPILASPLEGEGTFSLPLQGES